MVVIGLGKNLLFKSILAHCAHGFRPSVRGTATAGCRGASFGKVENLFQPQSLSAWLKSRWHHKKEPN